MGHLGVNLAIILCRVEHDLKIADVAQMHACFETRWTSQSSALGIAVNLHLFIHCHNLIAG